MTTDRTRRAAPAYVRRMYVERVELTGFGGLPSFDGRLGRAARFDGPARACVAFQDALALAFGAWDARVLAALLERWGCEEVAIVGEKLPEAARWSGAPGLVGVFDPLGEGLLTVALTLLLDPPQFGVLRRLSAKDPRLVDALSDGARLRARIGARMSPGLDALAIDLLQFTIGEESFPIAGADRPPWMTPFLQGFSGRFFRGGVPGTIWGERARSYRAADHRALQRACAALGGPVGGLGEVVALPDGPAAFIGDAVVSVRHLGERAQRGAAVVGAVHLSNAEILAIEPDPEMVAWLGLQAEADGSALEQVILVGVPGGIPLVPPTPIDPAPTRRL